MAGVAAALPASGCWRTLYNCDYGNASWGTECIVGWSAAYTPESMAANPVTDFMNSDADYKQQAALQALELVRSEMVLGLGSGSTIAHFIDGLGARLRSGQLQRVIGVPTSLQTAQRAKAAGIALAELAAHPHLDLAVDGADEIDPQCNLIKGLGRALLREKIVAQYALQFVVVADDSKRVGRLGTRCPLPVEILPFEAAAHVRWLGTLGCRAELWCEADGTPLLTDNGNQLARCWFADGISNPAALAQQLQARAGIIEHGLFLGLATRVITVGADGVRDERCN